MFRAYAISASGFGAPGKSLSFDSANYSGLFVRQPRAERAAEHGERSDKQEHEDDDHQDTLGCLGRVVENLQKVLNGGVLHGGIVPQPRYRIRIAEREDRNREKHQEQSETKDAGNPADSGAAAHREL